MPWAKRRDKKKKSDTNEVVPPPPLPPPPSPAFALLVFVVVFAVYSYTCYPSVSGGDAGELVVTACNMGTAHPPGYPLFTMLGRLFITILPFGHKAWRVNMMSAYFGSLAAMFLHLAAAKLTRSPWPGLVAAFGFAFSPTVWLYSIQGEVFALNNALCCALTYLTARYFLSENPVRALRVAYLGAFVCGLALTNQHTTVFYVGITMLAVTWSLFSRGQIIFWSAVKLCVCLLLGLSPYLYLPFSSFYKVRDSWGDMRSLEGFLHHFLRREYGTFQLAADGTSEDPGMVSRLIVYANVLLSESLYITPLLALVGLLSLFSSSSPLSIFPSWPAVRRCGSVFLLNYLVYMGVFHYLANLALTPLYLGVQARFWQQANLFIYLWAAVGFHALTTLIFRQDSRKHMALATLALTYGAVQCGVHFDAFNHRNNYAFYAHGTAVLRSFPLNSLVFLNGDLNNNAIKYPQQCEGVRPDVRLVSLQLMTWDWWVDMQAAHYDKVVFPGNKYHPRVPGAFSFKQILDANVNNFSVYICGPYKEHDDSWKAHYHDIVFGHCQRILPNQRPAPPGGLTKHFIRGYSGIATTKALGPWLPQRYTDDTWENVLYFDSWKRRVAFASIAAFYSNKNLSDVPLLKLANDVFADMFSEEEFPWLKGYALIPSDMYRSAGIVSGQYSKALTDMNASPEEILKFERNMVANWQRYLELNPADKEIKQLVEAKVNPYTGAHL